MQLDSGPESGNVEDRRGMKRAGIAAGGGGLLIVILGLIFGVDLSKLGLGGGGGQQVQQGAPPDDGYKQFASKILGLTEDVWDDQFKQHRYGRYEKPKMVLFSDGVDTKGCGSAPSEVGPFYCPRDNTVYLDPTFFNQLERDLGGSKAQFSQAYVIAHEVGHHVQNLLGYAETADSKRGQGKAIENEYSIRLELQADYLAGVWAHHAERKFKILEPGDVEQALKTAKSIGDNRIQEKMKGRTWPESFNHGTDRQRYAAFSNGLKTGDASKAKLSLFFDPKRTPISRERELVNSTIFGP
jgi:uncharacterized protein